MVGRPSTSVRVQTIQRNIINMAFQSRRPTRVPLLTTAQHKALRIAWVRQHRYWIVDAWKHFAWSVESNFQLSQVDGYVLRV